jgi:hypothetical protein
MTTCFISQPRFFPGLHYLHRMMVADVFVILDTVQFNPRHEENRARLLGPQGPVWLTAPMCQTHREQRIAETRIDNEQPWRKKALGTLQSFYGKAPCFKEHAPTVFDLIQQPCDDLVSLDLSTWRPALEQLGIRCDFVRASELPVEGKGPRLLLDICKHLGADVYLSGAFGRQYLGVEEFGREGVQVRFHEYEYPLYRQRQSEFVPYLSYLDMLFQVGLCRDTVLSGGAAKLCQPS